MGLPRAATYYIATDPSAERSVLRALRLPVLLQIGLLTVLQGVILWLLVRDDPGRVKWAAIVVLPMLAGAIIDYYCKAVLQGQGRYFAFNVLRNGSIAFYLVGVLLAFGLGDPGLVEFAVALSAAAVLAGVVCAVVALSTERSPQSAVVTRAQLVRFGLRGYLVSLSPIGTFQLDQALIGLMLPARDLGLYVAALAFTNLPLLISRSIGVIAFPQVARTGDSRAQEMRRFFVLSLAATGAVVVLLELAAGWIVPLFFGAEFEDAVLLTRILLVGSFFAGARRVLADITSGSGRPGITSIAELSSWVVIVPALAVLAPLFGVPGVAVATVISSFASFSLLLVLLRRAQRRTPGAAIEMSGSYAAGSLE
jgi:O-antigen/teichoic acid export membrane protein